MNTFAEKTQDNKTHVTAEIQHKRPAGGGSTIFTDNRSEMGIQRSLQEMADNSPQTSRLRTIQNMGNNSIQSKTIAKMQNIADSGIPKLIQRKENNTGLPDGLKSGVEYLSGYSMDDVKVYYNSPKPAQLQAHAYAQGTDIHIAPSQERHLPHEAWHVVQQKQGRVKPTLQLKNKTQVNDDNRLEKEADVMGLKAVAASDKLFAPDRTLSTSSTPTPLVQRIIRIDDIAYTHASIKINSLYERVATELESKGYKTYGIKSKLIEFVESARALSVDYGTFDKFWQSFFPWLEWQTRIIKGTDENGNPNTTPVLKKFSVSAMARPSWPKELLERKGYQLGDNIRHVVRNATLKRALQVQFDNLRDVEARAEYFGALASQLGIPYADSLDKIISAIYKALYLNPDNLFSGDGPTNQIIGLIADPVKKYGEELIDLKLEVDIGKAFDELKNLIMTKIEEVGGMVCANQEDIEVILKEIMSFVDEIRRSVVEASSSAAGIEHNDISAEEIGDLIADIGLNFGFDLIDGRVPEDQENIGVRQGRLVEVETRLQRFIASNGKEDDLSKIFSIFMGSSATTTTTSSSSSLEEEGKE